MKNTALQTFIISIFFAILLSSLFWSSRDVDSRIFYLRDYSIICALGLSIFLFIIHIYNKSYIEVQVSDLLILFVTVLFVSKIQTFNLENETGMKAIGFYLFFLAVRNSHFRSKEQNTLSILFILFFFILSLTSLYYGIRYFVQFDTFLPLNYNLDNSGVLGNYLALGFPIVFNGISLFKNNKQTYLYYFAIATCLLILLTLFLTFARAAWLAVLISSAIIIIKTPQYKSYFKGYFSLFSKYSKFIVFFFPILLCCFKYNSMIGRVFINKISLLTIADNVWTGYGINNFSSAYHLHQATYFNQNKEIGTKEWFVADSLRMAYNEYLQIFIEMGILGFMIFFCIIALFIRNFIQKEKIDGAYIGFFASLMSVLICGLFSYPFQETPICLLFILLTAIIAPENDKTIFTLNISFSRLVALFLIGVSINATIILFKIFDYKKQWLDTARISMNGIFEEKKYADLYVHLNTNSRFLYNYGCELSKEGQYKQSIEVLDKAMEMVIDEKNLCFQAENYYQTGDWQKAEEAYILACNMVPSRLFPKYYLLDFYTKTHNNNKAIETADKIVIMPEKISNEQSRLIKLTTKTILDSLQSGY